MSYTAEHAYLTFGGTLPGGEIWQTGMRYQKYGVPGGTWESAFAGIGLEDIYDDLAAWFAEGNMLFGATAKIAWAKLASIGTDGNYTLEPRIWEPVTPGSGGTVSFRHPNQVSTVVSLRSGSTFGRANYGRLYLPPVNYTVDATTGKLASGQVSTMLSLTNAMLEAVGGEMDSLLQPLRLAIFSAVGTGTTKPVTTVAIGDVLDTQRRRRNGLVETYTEAEYSV